jgi:hypothetical protein
MYEIERAVGQLDNMEVTITASIGEHFWNDVIEGYSRARIYNSTLRLAFLGGSPQVFKPGMVFTSYVSPLILIWTEAQSLLSSFDLTNSSLVSLAHHILPRRVSSQLISSLEE